MNSVFQVVNIDQEGNNHLPGKIEVTAEDIVLHQKKKEAISWPIRTLRRYGFESNIFSFEVGRRCPTGEGIFAFRCDQAEQLFKLLQTNIQVIQLIYLSDNEYLKNLKRHFQISLILFFTANYILFCTEKWKLNCQSG